MVKMGAFHEGLPHHILATEFSLKFRDTVFPSWIKELPPIFAKYGSHLAFSYLDLDTSLSNIQRPRVGRQRRRERGRGWGWGGEGVGEGDRDKKGGKERER